MSDTIRRNAVGRDASYGEQRSESCFHASSDDRAAHLEQRRMLRQNRCIPNGP